MRKNGKGITKLDNDDNVLTLGNTNDTVYARGGDDEIYGSGGNDTLNGENGDDVLDGGNGEDKLNGGRGDDTLSGGAGQDVLIGGAGEDIFAYELVTDSLATNGTLGDDSDRIDNFRVGADSIDLSGIANNADVANLLWNGFGPLTAFGVQVSKGKDDDQMVLIDATGDGKADMAIRVDAKKALTINDFFGVSQAASVTPARGSVSITIDPVTGDNVINGAEAAGSITINGRATGDAKEGDLVTLTIGGAGGTAITQALAADLTFSFSAAGSAFLSANDKSLSVSIASPALPSTPLASASQAFSNNFNGPVVSGISFLGDGTFRAGETILIKVDFNEALVNFTGGSAVTQLMLSNGETAIFDTQVPNRKSIIFNYLVKAGDDVDTLSVTGFVPGFGATGQTSGNPASFAIAGITQANRPEIDTEAPGALSGGLFVADGQGGVIPVGLGGGFSSNAPIGFVFGVEANAMVFVRIVGPAGDAVYGPGGTLSGKDIAATLNGDGEWQFDLGATGQQALLAGGVYSVQLIHQDAAGNRWEGKTINYTHIVATTNQMNDLVLTGTQYDDVLKASTSGNTNIYGDGGNDVLEGGNGDDYITGWGGYSTDTGEDDDLIFGSRGNDQIYGGTVSGAKGVDTLSYAHLAGAHIEVDMTDLSAGRIKVNKVYDNNPKSQYDLLDGIAVIIGTAGNDIMKGDNTDNVFYGLDGDDTLQGGLGDDVIYAGDGEDTLDGGGDHDILSYADFTGDHVEINLSGAEPTVEKHSIVVNPDPDVIPASYELIQTDTVSGFEAYEGTDGDDVFTGGDTSVTWLGGFGEDTLDGGTGELATLDYSWNAGLGRVVIDLSDSGSVDKFDEDNEDVGTDSITGFNIFIGTAGDDEFTGDDNDNEYRSHGGEDTVLASGGGDVYSGDEDGFLTVDYSQVDGLFDHINVNLKSGTVLKFPASGQPATDELYLVGQVIGTAGDDSFTSGTGVDVMTGGDGEDSFYFASGDTGITLAEADVITDFVSGTDKILLGFGIAGHAGDFTAAAKTFDKFIADTNTAFANPTQNAWAATNVASTSGILLAIDANNDNSFGTGDLLIFLENAATFAQTDFIFT